MPKTLLCESSSQTVKTRPGTLLQTKYILHTLLTNPACYLRRKVPGKMLHLDVPFHWKHLLITKRTLLTLTTCSWGHLSTLCTPDEMQSTIGAATAVPGGTCPPLCTSDEVQSTTGTTAGVAAIRAWVSGPIWPSPDCSRDICPSIWAPDEIRASWAKLDLATICVCVGRPTWGPWSSRKLILIGWLGSPWFSTAALQFSSASSAGITGFNGWSLCCSIWAVDNTVSDPILTILSTSRVRTTGVTTWCRVSTVRVDPLPPIGSIPSVSSFWDPPGLHLPLRNLPDCWSRQPLTLLTLCPHTLSLVPQTITQSPPGLMPNIFLPTAFLPALLPIVKPVGPIPSGILSSFLLLTGDLSLLIALVSSLTPLLRCYHPRPAVRFVGPFFHCQLGSSESMQVSHLHGPSGSGLPFSLVVHQDCIPWPPEKTGHG